MLNHFPAKSKAVTLARLKMDAYGDAMQPGDDALAAARNDAQAAQDALNAACAAIDAQMKATLVPLANALNDMLERENELFIQMNPGQSRSSWYPRGLGDWGHMTDMVYDLIDANKR